MTFTIDVDNNITVLASSQQIEERPEGTETFSSPHQLAAVAAKWPGSRLVEIWNGLPGVEPVERFTSWQTHSVRGFVSGHLKKKLGLKVRSSQRDGERVYSIKQ